MRSLSISLLLSLSFVTCYAQVANENTSMTPSQQALVNAIVNANTSSGNNTQQPDPAISAITPKSNTANSNAQVPNTTGSSDFYKQLISLKPGDKEGMDKLMHSLDQPEPNKTSKDGSTDNRSASVAKLTKSNSNVTQKKVIQPVKDTVTNDISIYNKTTIQDLTTSRSRFFD